MPFNIEEGFKVGQAIAGEDSTMSSFVKQMAARLQQKRELEQKFQMGVAQEQALGPIRTQQAVSQAQQLAPIQTQQKIDEATALAPIQQQNDITKLLYEGDIKRQTEGALQEQKYGLEAKNANDWFQRAIGQGGIMAPDGSPVTPGAPEVQGNNGIMVTGGSLEGPGGMRLSFETPQKGQIEAQTAAAKDAQTRLSKLKDLIPLIQTFEARISELPGGSGAAGRAGASIRNYFMGKSQEDPRIESFEGFSKGIRPQIARGLGDVANLAVAEQEAAAELFGTGTNDSYEVRAGRLATAYGYMIERTAAGNGITPDEIAQRLGMTYDSRTKKANSLQLDMIRNGLPAIYPEREGGILRHDKVNNSFAIVYPDGTYEEIERVK